MEHFVTLLDSLFLPQGLALHMSMERHVKAYSLWVLCVDDETHEVLKKLKLPNVRLLKLSTLETEELRQVKLQRTKGEFCWTLTPFAPRFVFEADVSVGRVTYVDADLWFRKSPATIFREFIASEKAVLITDHAYAPENDTSAQSGQYCVQFLTFTRQGGEVVRKLWEEQCIEWCYARFEEGKFGDQKYLDYWPEKYNELVHVLQQKELALAPWNAARFPYGSSVFYHFHLTRIVNDQKINIGLHPLPRCLMQAVYKPYFCDLKSAIRLLNTVDFKYRSQAKPITWIRTLGNTLRSFYAAVRVNLQTEQIKW